MIYNIYYLRATQTKFAALISLAVRLGILSVSENGTTYAPEGAYDYIGTIPVLSDTPDAEGIYQQVGEKKNAEGEVLYHANLALPYSLNAVGAAIAEEDTETAAVFTALQEYFVTSSVEGKVEVTEPAAPARVFFDADAYFASLPPPSEPPIVEVPTGPAEGEA